MLPWSTWSAVPAMAAFVLADSFTVRVLPERVASPLYTWQEVVSQMS